MNNAIRLGEIAHARSGDKGGHANVGVVAYSPAGYEHLCSVLTEQEVSKFFAGLRPTQVQRFELPGIHALNFLLHNVLEGGASLTLRTDSQGKILGLAILEMLIPQPIDLESMQKESAIDNG